MAMEQGEEDNDEWTLEIAKDSSTYLSIVAVVKVMAELAYDNEWVPGSNESKVQGKTASLANNLIQFDANNGEGFSASHYSAETILPGDPFVL